VEVAQTLADQTLQAIQLPPSTDDFTWGYIDCALWSTLDDDGLPLDANYDATDLAPETLERRKADSGLFSVQYWDSICRDLSRAGHNFWLTRNNHGAGFWDGDWPEDVGADLTEACLLWGEVDLFIGGDSKIYGT
jgi:hypothetical protein